MNSDQESVFTFLKVTDNGNTVDRDRLEKLRSEYEKIKSAPSVTTSAPNTDDQLRQLAQMFKLADDPTNLEHLKLCVTSSKPEIACKNLSTAYMKTATKKSQNAKETTNTIAKTTTVSAQSLSQIICQILIKRNHPLVIDFIEKFLVAPIAQTASYDQK